MKRRWARLKPGRKTASFRDRPGLSLVPSLPLSAVVTRHGGAVGICPCPGRKFPPALGALQQQNLTKDLKAIQSFPAVALVTLMEMGELDWAGPSLGDLQAACAALGLLHFYLPIEDEGIPDAHWERRWQTHGSELHAMLQTGQNIFFHCRGGRGRAGLAVTRMLIEIGEDPVLAMARVRAVRPGAIETAAQEEYLRSLAG